MPDIKKSELVPFDPSRLSIEAIAADGPVRVNREPQRSNLLISLDDLARLLGLPADHRVERVVATDPQFAPGLMIMVEGPAMTHSHPAAPVQVEQFSQVIDDIDERRRAAAGYWLRLAVKPKAFT